MFCVVVVFVGKLEVCQKSYTKRRFRVYQHLKDLNNERPDTEDAKVLRYKRKCMIFEHRHVEE